MEYIGDLLSGVRYFFKRKKNQVNRVIDFLPMIWNGFDFDYSYSIDLFKKQLERTADFMESDRAMTVDADIRARRIRTAIELLQKVYDEEYGCQYQDQLKEIYGDKVLDWWFDYTGREDGSAYIRFEYEKWDNAEEVKEVKGRLYQQSKEKQKRAEKLVWDFIGHNIRYWWD
jgi:hypothetical protein